MGIDVATALELRHRGSPILGCRVLIVDIGGDGSGSEEPNIDVTASPLCREDSSALSVEVRAIGICALVLDIAAGVSALAWRVDVAIRCGESAGKGVIVGDCTAVGSV